MSRQRRNDGRGNPYGQIVDTEHSNGLGVWECYKRLFRQNEKAWKAKDYLSILTDPEMVEQMKEWFPDRRTFCKHTLTKMRNMFNRRLERLASYRYMRDAQGRIARATARGMILSDWKG